ncbi:UDP-glycosyltransferase 83A1-like isoform X2 [Salvia hispanica]|uniref:UDP-glycosyltransferase 83A1-like isoform X2 n=1 Tax=Salvia hispanica TaxID=49212 RepID=UPI002009778D|nr:UDP-glycosyltransferase 83A1-like isoform X2 [Salvia hispanica]
MGKSHAQAHIMMVAFPMQGHVIPLLELAQVLATHGIRTTFVNTDMVHDRVVNSLAGESLVGFVSVPDGLEPHERYVPGKLTEAVYTILPGKVQALIREINDGEDRHIKVSCLVYDQSIGSLHQVARDTGIRSVAFLPAAAALLVLGLHIPQLLRDGIIDDQGNPLDSSPLQLAPTMPIVNPTHFVWHTVRNTTLQKLILDVMRQNNHSINSADWVICNSARDLEPGASTLAPQITFVGPLLASNRLADSAGQFYQHDKDSLEWLDQQPPSSVIYVSFGSYAILGPAQFQKLALGLELTNRPFLWVVRPDAMPEVGKPEFPNGFLERTKSQGRIVGWANQQKVLSHPSVACFVSHCGWNSTLESVSNGVPMLCWPCYADQFINQSYICDIWRVGLQLGRDNGVIFPFDEIKEKIDRVVGDEELKGRALQLKEVMGHGAREGGTSYQNLKNFITWLHE